MRSFLVVACFWLSACRPTVHFETQVEGTATVSGSVLGSVLALPGLSGFSQIDFSQTQEFKNRGVRKEDVEKVQLQSFQLRITDPADGNFQWLDSIRFYAEADGRRELIAEKTNVKGMNLPGPHPAFLLEIRQANLLPYVTAASMNITSEGTGSQPSKTTSIEATVKVGVEAFVIR